MQCAERDLPYIQKLANGCVAGDLRANRQRAMNKPMRFSISESGRPAMGADNVLCAGVAMQQNLVRRHQHYEQRDFLLANVLMRRVSQPARSPGWLPRKAR
jgi:hypothetical protein